ncbi:hypothetical protein GC163_13400 [bacterium]|nr:hypothetical protein [bacterium]
MPSRSTTSSTTGRTRRPRPQLPAVLTTDEQQTLVEWLLRGASPAAACAQFGWPVERFWKTLAQDEGFTATLQQVFDTLSQNVLAALYQAAMKGQVSAQQFWLRHRPVTGWTQSLAADLPADSYEQLNDDELVDACVAAGLDLPTAIAARLATAARRP